MANHERAWSVTPRYEAPPHLADVGGGTAESSDDRHLDAVLADVSTEAEEAGDLREGLLGLVAEVLFQRDQPAGEVDAVHVVGDEAADLQRLPVGHVVVVDLTGGVRPVDPDLQAEAGEEGNAGAVDVDVEGATGGDGSQCGHDSHARFRSCRWYRRGAPSQTTRLI